MSSSEGRLPEPLPAPPGASAAVQRVAGILYRPVERFLAIEASSGLLLIFTTALALLWANSSWAASYHHLWETQVGFSIGRLAFSRDLHFWISDGLMVVFFFVVGLEIRREMYEGELSEPRRAALPVVAALGGMLAPALIYLALNRDGEAHRGWAIPTATDIAFAVGVLTLLGKRVPAALRIFLLALAVIDDIGAILVIAFFYSSGVSFAWLAVAAGGVVAVLFMQRLGVRQPWLYVAPGVVIWAGLLGAGVHPTIGGVILGLLTPARPWLEQEHFASAAAGIVGEVRDKGANGHAEQHELVGPLGRLNLVTRETLSPVVRLEAALHPWVAYLVMPLFALANAGVGFGEVDMKAANVGLGAALGLFVGKPVGIVLATLAAAKTGLLKLPRGMGLRELFVAGCLGGIGFTMAIFIAILAFPAGGAESPLGLAKLAIFAGSTAAALAGLLAGRLLLPICEPSVAAITLEQAEQSTED